MCKQIRFCVFALAVVLCPARLAHADLLAFNLTPATLTSAPGGTVEFTGTLNNPGTTDVFLNGDVNSLPYTKLTVDDSPFFIFSQLFLMPGQTYTGPFFDVTVDAAAVPGSYSGSFTIQGGADANAFDSVASENFTVTVSKVNAPVPEPVGVVLLASCILLTGIISSKRFALVQGRGAFCLEKTFVTAIKEVVP